MPLTKPRDYIPVLGILLPSALWATNGPIIKALVLPIFYITFIRFLLPAIIAGGYLLYAKERLPAGRHASIITGSILNFFKTILLFYAFSHATVASVSTVNGTWPITASLAAMVMLKEKLSAWQLLGIMLGFIGITLVHISESTLEYGDLMGLFAAFLATLCGALGTVLFKKEIHRYTINQAIFARNALGAVLTAPALCFITEAPPQRETLYCILFAMFVGYLPFLPYYYSFKRLPVSIATPLANSEVLFAIFYAVFFVGETPTVTLLIGAALIVISVYAIAQASAKPKTS
jgi:drug/metabolite transporter (DMT)-like permease